VSLDRNAVVGFHGRLYQMNAANLAFIRWLFSAYNWNVRKVVWAIARMLQRLWAWVLYGILGAEMLWR
jgi:hypothetical protein